MNLEERTKIQICHLSLKEKKGEHVKVLENIKKSGYVRARIDGELVDLIEDEIKLEKNKKHIIEVVIDRLVIKEGIEARLNDSLETALKLGEGLVIVNIIDGEDILFSEHFACVDCGISIGELSPQNVFF